MTKILLLGAFLASTAVAASDWEHIYDKEGIQVYRKTVPGSDKVAFKGVGNIDASPAKVAGVLANVERKMEWVANITQARLIREIGPMERIEYNETNLPWPISNRDFVFHAKADVDGKTGVVYFKIESIEDEAMPEQKGLVRALLDNTGYELLPLEGGNKTALTVQVHADPRGMLPAWLVNLLQKKWPLRTIKGIREQVARDDVEEFKPVADALAKLKKK